MKGFLSEGYEIHMGETILDEHASGLVTIENDSDTLQQGTSGWFTEGKCLWLLCAWNL